MSKKNARRKNYGSVKGRGRTVFTPRKKREAIRKYAIAKYKASYVIPPGRELHVRKPGDEQWIPHQTIQELRCVGYIERTRKYWIFLCTSVVQPLPGTEWELKVPVGQFRVW